MSAHTIELLVLVALLVGAVVAVGVTAWRECIAPRRRSPVR